MKHLLKIMSLILLCVLSFFMNNKGVFAYYSDSSSISNEFTVGDLYTDTFIYNAQSRDGSITELGREVKKQFEGATVSLDAPTGIDLTGLTFNNITINGSGSHNIGDTFTQSASDTTIIYTYTLNGYRVTYTGDTDYYTYSNTKLNVNQNQRYTTTITPVEGKDIDTVTVTMGGTNITSSYNTSTNTLSVNRVTGNIVINVTTKTKAHSITYSGNNFTHSNNATSVNHGDSFTTTLSASIGNISSVTVTMGGVDISSTAYSNGTVTINSVTGDVQISVTTTCLVEGTKITLYDGSTKNIEDIKYNDLIKVWNHDKGTYDYEYAGWIEQAGVTNSYTKVTFTDGTVLKVVGGHSLFSKRLNKYVEINSGELKVGDEVVSLRDGIGYLKIKKIETVNEEVKYYHIITTRYFNLIANGVLTTYEIFDNISNFMEFDENLKWKNTEEVRSDMYTYNDFNYLPKYIYKVFRLEETKYLVKNGLVSLDELKYLFNSYLTDDNKMVKPPTNSNGTRLWMVTTSDDTDLSNTRYQLEEGSIYVVPTPKKTEGFKKWYNSSDNKYYSPGDKIEVYGGMHLTAIYK